MALQFGRCSIKNVEKSHAWANLITLVRKFLLEFLPSSVLQRLPVDSETNLKNLINKNLEKTDE